MFPSFILLLFLTAPALTTPTSLQVRGHRTPRDTKPDSIKVVISEGVVSQGDSADVSHGGREIDLTPGSPLVLTHRIKLVPSGPGPGLRSGSCGCDLDLAPLRERLERLEREVSALREKCDGGCTSKESKGPGSSIKPSTECPNECSDQGRCEDGVCVCFPGFSGPDCSRSNCPGNCNDRGRCVNGQCVCDPGFTAADCSQTSCPDACSRRGKCVNGRCVCDGGFSGPSCSDRSCPGNCNGRGRCLDGKCVCNPGFTGPDCSKRACPNACSSRGRCVSGKCVCDGGFTGTDCSEASCPGNCNRQGRCVNGKCVCNDGFTGPDCSERTCPNDCSDRGRCVDGNCVCNAGFTGTDCSEASCPGNCNSRGRCINGQCVCDNGFTGTDCSERACPGNCNSRGRCLDGKCACNPGFTGPDCSKRACPNDCRDQGKCVNGKCVCNPGFTGTDCSEKTCPNDCSDRGRCVDGICACNPGFTGTDCSEKTCPNDCSDRGRCVDGNCVCDGGFTGSDCSEVSCPGNCYSRGSCVNGQCVCNDGFTGTDCSERSCPNDCSDRGRCVDGKCVCDGGFTGPDCSEASCPGNCNKRGRCVNGQCICNPGFTGPDCSKRACPKDCSGNGKCVDGKCVCDGGFTGPDCSKASCPGNCNKRGRCVDGRCVCNAGFTGPDCSVRACPKDCSGNGKCVDGKCVCDVGFTGPVCGAKACPENCSNKGRCIKGRCVCRKGFTGPDCSQCEDGKTGPNCETVMSGVSPLSIRGVTETSVTLEWTQPQVQYDTYDIVFTSQKDSEQPIRVQVDGVVTSYTQTGLASGQNFTVSVTGEVNGRRGTESSAEFSTLISGPSDLRVVKTTSTSAVVQWAESQGEIDRYRLTVTPSDGSGDAREVTVDAGRDSAHIQQLEAGLQYDVSLVAEKGSSRSEATTTNVTPGKIFPAVTTAATTLASELKDVVELNPSLQVFERPMGEEGESGGSREDSTTSVIAKTKPLVSKKTGVNGTRPKVSERLTLYRRPEVSGPSPRNATRVVSGGKKFAPLKKKPPVEPKKKKVPIAPKKPKPGVPKDDGTTTTRHPSVAVSRTEDEGPAMMSGNDPDTKRQRSSGEPTDAGGSKEQPDVGTAERGNNNAPVSPAPTGSLQSQDKKCMNKVKVTHVKFAQRGRGSGCREDGTVAEADETKSPSDVDYSSKLLHELLIDTSDKMNITSFSVYVSKLSNDSGFAETVKKPSLQSSSSAPPPTEPPSRSSPSSSSFVRASSTTAATSTSQTRLTSSPPSSPPTSSITTADKSGSGGSHELDIDNGKSVTAAPEARKPSPGKGVVPIFQRTPGLFRRQHPNFLQNRTRPGSKVPPRLTLVPRRETETELSSSPTSSVDFSEPMRDANGDGATPPASSGVETQKKLPPGRGRLPIRRLPPKDGSMLRRPNVGFLQNRTRPNLRPFPPPARPSHPASETRREQETPTEFPATSLSRPAEGSGPVVAENGDRVETGLSSVNTSTEGIGGSRAPFPQRPIYRRPHGGRILNGNRTYLRPPQYPHRGPPRKFIPTRKINGGIDGGPIRKSEETRTDNVLENQSGTPDSPMPTQGGQIQQPAEQDTAELTPDAQLEGRDTTMRPQINQLEGVGGSPIQTTKSTQTNGQDSNPDVQEDRTSAGKRTGATSRATSSSVFRHEAKKPVRPAEQDTSGVTPSAQLEGQDTTITPFIYELEGVGSSPIQTTKSTQANSQDLIFNVHEDRASVGEDDGATSRGRPTIKQTSQEPAEQDIVAVTPSAHIDGQDTTVKPPINDLEGVDSAPTRSNGQDSIPEVQKKKPIAGKNTGAIARGRPMTKQTPKKPVKPAKKHSVAVTPSSQLEGHDATTRPPINGLEGVDSGPVQTRPNGQDLNPDIQKKKPIAGKNIGATNRGRLTFKQTPKKPVKPAKKHSVEVTSSAHTDGEDTTVKPPINDLEEDVDSGPVQTRPNGQDSNPEVQKKKPIAGATNRGRPTFKQTFKKPVKPAKKPTVEVTPGAHTDGEDTTVKPPINELDGVDSAPVQTRPNGQDSRGRPTIKQTPKKTVKPADQDTVTETPSVQTDGPDTTIKPPINELEEDVDSSLVQTRPNGQDTSRGRPTIKPTSQKPVKPAEQDTVTETPSVQTDGQDTTVKPPIKELEGVDSAPVQTRPNGQDSNPEVQRERPIAGKNAGATSRGRPMTKQTPKKPVKPATQDTVGRTPSVQLEGHDATTRPPINDLEEDVDSAPVQTRPNGQDSNPEVQKERPIAGKNAGATSQGRPTIKQTPVGSRPVKPPKKPPATRTTTPQHQMRPNGGIKRKDFIKPNATKRLLDGRQPGSPESKPQPGSGLPSTGVSREPLDHVAVTNRTSDGFTLVWDSPEDKYKNFVVTSKDVGKQQKKRPEVSEDEGTGNRIPEEGTKPVTETDQTFKKVLPGSARSFQFENLPSMTDYVVTLMGKSPGLLSRLHKLVISTGPEPPTDIVFSDLTENSVTVSWTKPQTKVSGFKVVYTGRDDGEPVSVSVAAGHQDVALTRLSPGSSYDVSVVSLHDLEESDPLQGRVTTRPDPPTDLRILNVTDSSALLSWQPANAKVHQYTITYGAGTSSEVRVTVSGESSAHRLDSLESSTSYRVTVSSNVEDVQSSESSSSFTTADSVAVDDGPRDLQAEDVTPRTARLSWKPPLAPPPSYRLTYQSEGQEVKEVTLDGDVTEVELKRLHPGATYTATLQPGGAGGAGGAGGGAGAGGAGGAGGGAESAISTRFTTGYLRFPFPSDCSEELLNGLRRSSEVEIFPSGRSGETLTVYCDMETEGGGWTVFQRRMDGSVDFFRTWRDYVGGFGNVSGEFWLGLENLQVLTSGTRMELRVDLRDGDDSAFAKYSVFQVAKRNYRLVVGGYSGTAGDSLTYHDQQVFSTKDRDVTPFITRCAMSYLGGWWYKNCHEANLNGLYNTNHKHQGVIWTAWRGKDHSVPFVEMKMRPSGFRG